jgi:hypothetical protein
VPRVCTVCNHEQRDAIDRALVNRNTFRYVAEQFSVSITALHRHKKAHIPATLTKAADAAEVAHADDLLAQVRELHRRARRILDEAEGAGDLGMALRSIREARSCLELLARLVGELQDQATVNVLVSPQWAETRAVVVSALAPFPRARLAVANALEAVDAGE